MAKFRVRMTKIPKLSIGKSDVIFIIRQDNAKMGTLRVSKGHLVWTRAKKKKSYWLSWDVFDKIAWEYIKYHREAYY